MTEMKTPIYLFPGGKSKAVTFSYDDGCIQDKKLIEIFNRYGMKATFNLNGAAVDGRDWSTLKRISADQIKELYAGHEVAAHAEFHAGLDRIAATDVIREIFNDRMILEKAAGVPVTGFAYPCGQYSEKAIEILRAAGFEYARTVENCGVNRYLPDDFLRWKPTCHHRDALPQIELILSEKRSLMQMLYIWGHSYEFDRDNNWSIIEEFASRISAKNNIWYATCGEIYNYVKAFDSLEYSVDGSTVFNPSGQTIYYDNYGKHYAIKPLETVKVGSKSIF